MVFSNKPLQFIVAVLVACLPLFSSANTATDSVHAKAEATHAEATAHTEKAAHGEHAEPTDLKSKINAYINHHVLDAHEFSLFEDEADYISFLLLNLIMVMMLQNLKVLTLN